MPVVWTSIAALALMQSAAAPPAAAPTEFFHVRDPLGKVGFIDATGAVRIPPQYLSAGPFVGDRCEVTNEDELSGYINRAGELVIPCNFQMASSFDDGLAAVCLNRKWGFIDEEGQFVIAPQFDTVRPQFNGILEVGVFTPAAAALAHASKYQISFWDACYRWTLIDRCGVPLGDPEFGRDGSVDPQLLIARKVGEQYGYVDIRGNTVIEPQFDYAEQFSEGLARAVRQEKSGYIDRTGKFQITGRFSSGWGFVDGVAIVTITDRQGTEFWGMIDRRGDFVIPCRYSNLGRFSEGLAYARFPGKGHKVGYINRNGDEVIPPVFDHAYSFRGGAAKVVVDGEEYLIDRKGNVITSLVIGRPERELRVPRENGP